MKIVPGEQIRLCIKQGKDDTKILYGTSTSFSAILKGEVQAPNGSQPFLTAVKKYAEQAKRAEVLEKRTQGGTENAAIEKDSAPHEAAAGSAKVSQ